MAWNNYGKFAIVILIYVTSVNCGPKYEAGGGFMPSSDEFLKKAGKTQDQIALPPQSQERSDGDRSSTKRVESSDVSERNQEPRFGFTNIGSTGTGYGGISGYTPAKIDLGGILLGAVIGVGTILVIPKLLYAFSGTYGAYARSEAGGLTQMMVRLDDALARHGIDTTSCMQRAVCTYAKQAAAAAHTSSGEHEDSKMTSVNNIVETIITNQVFRTAMEGTAVQEAVEAGQGGQSCTQVYPHCGFSMESILSLFYSIASPAAKNVKTTAASVTL